MRLVKYEAAYTILNTLRDIFVHLGGKKHIKYLIEVNQICSFLYGLLVRDYSNILYRLKGTLLLSLIQNLVLFSLAYREVKCFITLAIGGFTLETY